MQQMLMFFCQISNMTDFYGISSIYIFLEKTIYLVGQKVLQEAEKYKHKTVLKEFRISASHS